MLMDYPPLLDILHCGVRVWTLVVVPSWHCDDLHLADLVDDAVDNAEDVEEHDEDDAEDNPYNEVWKG